MTRIVSSIRAVFTLLRDTWRAFLRDDVSLLGAAMVYYALLSLGPLLLVLLAALGFAFSFLPAGIDAREHLLYLADSYLGAAIQHHPGTDLGQRRP